MLARRLIVFLSVCISFGRLAAAELELTLASPSEDTVGCFGHSVSSIGDVDGDTVPDLIVGAFLEDPGTTPRDAGRAYVFSGATGVPILALSSPYEQSDGFFGEAVAGAGDVDGDGHADVLVGTYDEWPPRVYLFSGASGDTILSFRSPSDELLSLFGQSIANIGDISNDGIADVIVGASRANPDASPEDAGRAYIFDGMTADVLFSLASPTEQGFGYFGVSVSGGGDVNGDGIPDVIVGASGEDIGPGVEDAGRAYVFSGASGALLYSLQSPYPQNPGYFGCSVAPAGDMNGDGRSDVIIGAYGEDPPGSRTWAGSAYVFSGASGDTLCSLWSPTPEPSGYFGWAVSPAGDTNGDGFPEVLVGAKLEDPGSAPDAAGRAYVFGAGPYLVTTTGDTGWGTLRQALLNANAHLGIDTITFQIPGLSPHSIILGSALPSITDPVIVDGYTQPGAYPATDISPATLAIEIDGQMAGGSAAGLDIAAGGCVVRGLAINGFSSHGVVLRNSGSNVLEGNFIGTDVTGSADRGNGLYGVFVDSVDGNTIGGGEPAVLNVISGNGSGGIHLVSASGTIIQGNHVGTDALGAAPLGNAGDGIFLEGSGADIAPNMVGGLGGAGNLIAHNESNGIRVIGNASVGIMSNGIFSNRGLAVDLGGDGVTLNDLGDPDSGPNGLQNYPTLFSTSTDMSGTVIGASLNSLANASFRVQFFYSDTCDVSGFGEGTVFVGDSVYTTDGMGNVTFVFSCPIALPPGSYLAATATEVSANNTSEYSGALYVTNMELTGSILGHELVLQWSVVPPANEYWVFGSSEDPFFLPGLVPPFEYRLALLPGTVWSTEVGVEDPEANWVYHVVAVDGSGRALCRSNRFGEYDVAWTLPF